RSSAAAARYFKRSLAVNRDSQYSGRSRNNAQQILRRIEFKPVNNPKTRTKRSHDQARSRRRADQCEMIQLVRMDSRSRPLPNDQVDAKILHRRIENLL